MLGVAQSVRQRLYVDAARVNGLGSLRGQPACTCCPAWPRSIAVQAAQLFGIAPADPGRPGVPRLRSGRAAAQLGRHDPGRLAAHLRRAVADGAHRCSCSRSPWSRPTSSPTRSPARRTAEKCPSARSAAPRRGVERRGTPADPTAVLEVRDLSVAVDDGPALVTGVSFSLRPGRVLGLVGESGCGKTMTARSLLGLLPDGVSVSGGSILWQGRELVGLPEQPAQRRPRPRDRDDLPGADGRPGPDVLRSPTS